LRWNKPSGRLILLIPACWTLWLTPSFGPSIPLLVTILVGGTCVSGAGCVANDLWDREFDKEVERTKNRPLAKGSIKISTAIWIFLCLIFLSLLSILALPIESRILCLKLSSIAIIPILVYPSTKRWFAYPQAVLSLCWGFAVLIPWAASESSLRGGATLLFIWLATVFWTFGFDTVYAMADKQYDKKIGLKSSAISLGDNAKKIVGVCYFIAAIAIAIAAITAGKQFIFWPPWLISIVGMQREVLKIKRVNSSEIFIGNHFQNQVKIGGLLLLALVLA